MKVLSHRRAAGHICPIHVLMCLVWRTRLVAADVGLLRRCFSEEVDLSTDTDSPNVTWVRLPAETEMLLILDVSLVIKSRTLCTKTDLLQKLYLHTSGQTCWWLVTRVERLFLWS